VNSFFQPRWVHAIVEDIQSSSHASIRLVVIRQPEQGAWQSFKGFRFLLYSAYSHLDNFKAQLSSDALERMNLYTLVSNSDVLKVVPIEEQGVERFREQDIDKIRSSNLDVIVYFGAGILKGGILNVAKYGVWAHHYGATASQQLTGFWELMEDAKITTLSLRVLAEESENERVLYSSTSALSDRFSAKLNRNELYWRLSVMVMRKMKELHACGNLTFQTRENLKPDSPESERVPSNTSLARPLLRLLGRYLASIWESKTNFTQWSLAFNFGAPDRGFQQLFDEARLVVPPSDRFWADPFPVKAADRYYVFVEECLYATRKGHIAVMELDDEGCWSTPVKVLERNYHLSYPCVFEWAGDYYMIPETLGNRSIELYRSVSFPLQWEFVKVLIPNINATDATIIKVENRWWIFANVAQRDFPVDWNELYLYYADSPTGQWNPHRENPVKRDARGSRPAGRLFEYEGALNRPAQNASGRYGYAISLNRVLQLNSEHYAEEEVAKILPREYRDAVGTHTINRVNELTVWDCLLRRKRFL
jgi:hypothetical protein